MDIPHSIYITGYTLLDLPQWIYLTGYCTSMDIPHWINITGSTSIDTPYWIYLNRSYTSMDIPQWIYLTGYTSLYKGSIPRCKYPILKQRLTTSATIYETSKSLLRKSINKSRQMLCKGLSLHTFINV